MENKETKQENDAIKKEETEKDSEKSSKVRDRFIMNTTEGITFD